MRNDCPITDLMARGHLFVWTEEDQEDTAGFRWCVVISTDVWGAETPQTRHRIGHFCNADDAEEAAKAVVAMLRAAYVNVTDGAEALDCPDCPNAADGGLCEKHSTGTFIAGA